MPWLETDVRDQRIRFVMTVRRGEVSIAAVCRAFGISEKTGHKWLRRYEAAGSVAALVNQSRRPHRSPERTSAAVTARVIALRRRYGWAGEKLALLLAETGIRLAPRTIDRIIAREHLTHVHAAPTAARQRFTRPAPNDLWQLDAKGHYPLAPRGRCYPLSVLDDHSRFAVGLYALPTLDTGGVRTALVECFEQYGVPHAMLMDHGAPWWASSNAAGLSMLSVFLLKQNIQLLHGRIRHPQTQGKVERFHRTLGERLRWWGVPDDLSEFRGMFRRFVREYNEVRPHEALGQEPPARHFRSSRRAYRARPTRWQYPCGSDVHRISQNGTLSVAGRRWFVSEALCGEEVACCRLDTVVLVRYRHMWIRELHPQSGRTRGLLRPVDAAAAYNGLPMS